MKRKFAISDIHGCAKTFEALLEKIAFSKSDELYLLGDYFDRGPDTKGVLDTIFRLQKDGYFLRCLMGNHEELFLGGLIDEDTLDVWEDNGGVEALESFGVQSILQIPKPYVQFVQNLDFYFEVDDYILVHAGLNFKSANPLQDKIAMLWIRKWYRDINYEWLGKRSIVHGHTPIFPDEIAAQFKNLEENRFLDIDTGCVFGKRGYAGLGRLTAFDLTNRVLIFQPLVD